MEDDAKRDEKAGAFSFHRNFKPALILFNERTYSDRFKVDGVFDPGKVTNAFVLGLSYRYESMKYGFGKIKFIMANMIEEMPESVKAAQAADPIKQIGYAGKDLGLEVDLNYTYKWGENIEAGVDLAYALAGEAFNIEEDSKTDTYLISVFAGYKF